MSQVTIAQVSSRTAQKRFLGLPWRLYAGDPNWVPPLRTNQAELAGFRRHPFYQDAESVAFLASAQGQDVGRIIAIQNHAYNRTHPKERIGFVGFFESTNDRAVTQALLDAAGDWLRDKGCEVMHGPVNPSMNYECGMLVKNFDMPPTFMMTYNPDYYPALWEACGCEGVQDLFTFYGHKSHLVNMEAKIGFVAEEAKKRFNIKTRTFDKSRFDEDIASFLDLYNVALTGNWGHSPMSTAELQQTAKALKRLIIPQLTVFAEAEGRTIGALFGLLDYNPRIKASDGRLFPFGFLRLLYNRRALNRLRVVSNNVVPEYQAWGVGVVLAYSLIEPALKWGIEHAEFSWVLESNNLSRRSLQRLKVGVEKVHRIYSRAL